MLQYEKVPLFQRINEVSQVFDTLFAADEHLESTGITHKIGMIVLNRYKPFGTTSDVEFKTTKPCFPTVVSHINQVVADTGQWEQSAAFRLEMAARRGMVRCYAKNDRLGLMIPYEYLGVGHNYVPDYIVRLTNGLTLLLEIKGMEDNQDKAKHDAARRWISAVNNWAQLGRWELHVCRSPQTLERQLVSFVKLASATSA